MTKCVAPGDPHEPSLGSTFCVLGMRTSLSLAMGQMTFSPARDVNGYNGVILQPMIPTFVFGWPTGEETGDFLSVDLGMWRFDFEPLRFFALLTTIIGHVIRWDEPAGVSRHPAGERQVRDHAIKVPPHGGAKARGRPEAV